MNAKHPGQAGLHIDTKPSSQQIDDRLIFQFATGGDIMRSSRNVGVTEQYVVERLEDVSFLNRYLNARFIAFQQTLTDLHAAACHQLAGYQLTKETPEERGMRNKTCAILMRACAMFKMHVLPKKEKDGTLCSNGLFPGKKVEDMKVKTGVLSPEFGGDAPMA